MKIGVLAVQGAFIEHEKMIEALGHEAFEIRQKRDLEQEFDGLILPGVKAPSWVSCFGTLDYLNHYSKRLRRECRYLVLAQG